MLKATVNDGKVEVVAAGDMNDICSELSMIIVSIAKNLGSELMRKTFKAVFASGFVNGVAYDVSREEMDEIMIEAYRTADEVERMARGKHEAK